MSASGTEPTTPTAAAEPGASPQPTSEDTVPFFQRFMERIGPFWTLGVLILLIVVFGILAPSLYSKAAWLSTSNYAVEYLILAIGETFVIITAGIDLSVGATLGFSGMLGSQLMEHMMGAHDSSALVAILGIAVMLASGVAIGVLNGLLITRIKLPPFIVTLGTLTAITGATDLLNNATEITTLPPFVTSLGSDSVLNGWLPLPVLISLVIAVVFGLVYIRVQRRMDLS
jgi:ribose transport system permease protein